jgi:hypothetical protein
MWPMAAVVRYVCSHVKLIDLCRLNHDYWNEFLFQGSKPRIMARIVSKFEHQAGIVQAHPIQFVTLKRAHSSLSALDELHTV